MSRAWYNGCNTMVAKPIKSRKLDYTMIQFLLYKCYSPAKGRTQDLAHSFFFFSIQTHLGRWITLLFVFARKQGPHLATNHRTNPPGFAGKIEKFRPQPEPIRLHDEQNFVHRSINYVINTGVFYWWKTIMGMAQGHIRVKNRMNYNSNVKSRRFGVIVTPFSRQSE